MEETKQEKDVFDGPAIEATEEVNPENQESEAFETFESPVEGSDVEESPVEDSDVEASPAEDSDADKRPEMTDEELDRIADIAIEALRSILAFFDAGECAIDEYEGDEGELILDVVGEDLAVLIGRYGKTLDALQYIVSSMASKKLGYHYPIAVDVEGYRNRRRQKLETLAKSAAARCIRSKKEVRLRPMTPSERRVIHIILRDENRVETISEGEDPQRQIVVKPRRV